MARSDIYYSTWTNPVNGWLYRLNFYPAYDGFRTSPYSFVTFSVDGIIGDLKVSQKFDSIPLGRPDAAVMKITFNTLIIDKDLRAYLAKPKITQTAGYQNYLKDIADNPICVNSITLFSDRGRADGTWTVEFAGIQKINSKDEPEWKKSGTTFIHESQEVEFIDAISVGLQNVPFDKWVETYYKNATGAWSYYQRQRLFSSVRGASRSHYASTKIIEEVATGQIHQIEEDENGDTPSQDGMIKKLSDGNSGLYSYSYPSIAALKIWSQMYGAFDPNYVPFFITINQFHDMAQWHLASAMLELHAGTDLNMFPAIGTAQTLINMHDMQNAGIQFKRQSTGSPSALTANEVYILEKIINRKTAPNCADESSQVISSVTYYDHHSYALTDVIGGVLAPAKGSWNELNNLWNLFQWLPSTLGCRIRWYYETVSNTDFTIYPHLYYEIIFSDSVANIDIHNALGDSLKPSLHDLAIRSVNTQAKMRDSDEVVAWKAENRGSDAESNVEFQLWVHNIPQRGTILQESALYSMTNGTDETMTTYYSTLGTQAIPSGRFARVSVNCELKYESTKITKTVSASDAARLQMALSSGNGQLMAESVLALFGKYEQATIEVKIPYGQNSIAIENLGRRFIASPNRFPTDYAYLGTDLVLLDIDVDHKSGYATCKFFVCDISSM